MFHLRTFGGLALDRDGAPVDGAQRKALAVLAVLAASPTKGVGRDRLMALLWPESDTEHARGALKQTIHVVRQLLGSPDAILGNAELRLNPAIITSDVSTFVDAIVEGDAARAVREYSGPFLESVHIESSAEFQRWADEVRADLSRRRAEAIEQLATTAARREDYTAAARWWQLLAASDALSGRVALNLMRAYEAAGDRAAALRHARVYAELLKQELGAEPDSEVVALAERLARAPTPLTRREAPASPRHQTQVSDVPNVPTLAPATTSRWPRLGLSLAVFAVLTLALLAWLNRRQSAAEANENLDPKRVAVGIFENETGDTTLAPLGKMAADWVVRGLARTGVVHVLDVGAIYAHASAGSREGALNLARRNGAGLAVAGRFYRDRGDSLVFTAAVVDVASSSVLHTLDPVRAMPNDALPAVEELRQRLTTILVAQVDPRATTYLRGPIGRPPTYDSYREFVAASELYWRGHVVEAVSGFQRAAALDSTFLAAAMWLITSSVTVDRCDVADSVIREVERRRTQFAPGDFRTLRARQSRCNRDWDQSVIDTRDRAAAEPWSKLPQWAVGANLRRANRPAEAIAVLRGLDPTRDLGWISDDGKVMYWRELAWAQHMLADVAGQQEAVLGLKRMAAGRLATAYFAALERVSAGKPNEVVKALDGVEALAPDPAVAMGEIAGRSPPERVGTPAWVLYQVGTELLSIGDSAGAVELARRALRWLETRSAAEQAHLEARYQRGLALELAGELDSAYTHVRQLSHQAPENIELRGRLGILAARRGDHAQARAVDDWLARHPPVQPAGVPQLERARIAAVLGERGRALKLIETLPFRAHPVDVVMFHSDPAFASLRSDARWIRMLRPRG